MGGDSCYNPAKLAFDNLRLVESYPAWRRAFGPSLQGIGGYGPNSSAAWVKAQGCHSARNLIANNVRMDP